MDNSGGEKKEDKCPKDAEPREASPPDDSGASGGSPEVEDTLLRKLSKFFEEKLLLKEPVEDIPKVLKDVSVDGVVEYIKSDECQNIVVMVGAGISTSAGIPDFRSPGSGLYDNLEKYNLPSPECMFDINFFRENPEPFFHLAKSLMPVDIKPTPCHYFLRLLHDKGVLRRVYSQNIDNLERIAGIPDDKIVEAHGSFHTSHCLKSSCRKEYSFEWIKEKLKEDGVPKCESCEGLVKPDIVFFGERLPTRFFQLSEEDFSSCDLLIIIGTSLTVQPFASLVDLVSKKTPRLVINLTKCGGPSRYERLFGLSGGLQFDSDENYRDVMLQGLCDDMCISLSQKLGWKLDLDILSEKTQEKLK